MYPIACNIDRDNDDAPMIPRRKSHEAKRTEEKSVFVRKRKICYQSNVKKVGTKSARNFIIKILIFCDDCTKKLQLYSPRSKQIHGSVTL